MTEGRKSGERTESQKISVKLAISASLGFRSWTAWPVALILVFYYINYLVTVAAIVWRQVYYLVKSSNHRFSSVKSLQILLFRFMRMCRCLYVIAPKARCSFRFKYSIVRPFPCSARL